MSNTTMKGGGRVAKKLSPWSKAAKIAMIQKDMSAQELADELGYNKRFLYSVLSGKTVSEKAIKRISNALEIRDSYDE